MQQFVKNEYDAQDKLNSNFAEVTAALSGAHNENLLINPNFEIWQRGASFTGGSIYTADRWLSVTPNAVTRINNDSPAPFTYAMQVLNTTTNGTMRMSQLLEYYSHLVGKTVTVSGYVKAIGAVSRISISTGGNAAANTATVDVVNTGWTKFSKTLVWGSNRDLSFQSTAFTSVNTDGYILAGLKLELGEKDTPNAPRPYAEEQTLCERYYEKSYFATSRRIKNFSASSTTMLELNGFVPFRSLKRTTPTVVMNYDISDASAITANPSARAVDGFGDWVIIIPAGSYMDINSYSADAEIYS